ncbi:MAG TPA: hypothetical protein VHP33_09575 [Polyangiaceae bacterium]|nr:hypothetical protein [Polyangiaceae bacterium]
MKSVVNERARARRLVVGAAFASVVVGFVACSGSTERKASPHVAAGGDATEVGGQAGAHQGGSESTAAGQTGLGGQAGAGAGGAGEGGVSAGGAGAGGAGGEIAQGGQAVAGAGAGAGGDAAGGVGGVGAAGEGGNGGAGGEAPFVDPVCGVNMVQVGAYSLWCGKVNQHKDANGAWQTDADCSSGCNIKELTYCKKYYPTATKFVDVPQVDIKDWKNAGFVSGQSGECNDSAPDSVGISGQAACCAPL